jgi:acylphosphatase
MSALNELTRAHVYISGRVQGVFYRAKTQEVAMYYGLTGWVKNCFDGRVEAVFEGARLNVESVIKWCNQGPPAAQVDEVDVKWENASGEFNTFSIRY